jgi:hypothetical protein
VAEKTVQTAEAKASMVDDLQNRNQELMKQIEICQVLPLFLASLSCGCLWLFQSCQEKYYEI